MTDGAAEDPSVGSGAARVELARLIDADRLKEQLQRSTNATREYRGACPGHEVGSGHDRKQQNNPATADVHAVAGPLDLPLAAMIPSVARTGAGLRDASAG